MKDTYLSISEISEGLYKEKGSKFLAFVYPVVNEDGVKAILDTLKKEYYDSRHICYAYRLGYAGDVYRINDDGEPSGSAGRPIHGQLLSFDLTNVLAVVVRYFGGTKLGVSGLVNAYKLATTNALENANIIENVIFSYYILKFEYPLMNDVMRIIKDEDYTIEEQAFELSCEITLGVRLSETERAEGIFSALYGLNYKIIR